MKICLRLVACSIKRHYLCIIKGNLCCFLDLIESVMKRKILVLFIAAMASLASGAQTLAKAFLSMPDSIIEYLDSDQRLGLVNRAGGGVPVFVVNSLGDSTSIESITPDYLRLKCNKARTLEIKLLPSASAGDSILCVVNTYYAPAAESNMAMFDTQWHRLHVDSGELVSQRQLISKPDSVSDVDFRQLCDMIDPELVEMHLSATDNSLTCDISLPDVPKEKSEQLRQLLVQKKLKWNGMSFN